MLAFLYGFTIAGFAYLPMSWARGELPIQPPVPALMSIERRTRTTRMVLFAVSAAAFALSDATVGGLVLGLLGMLAAGTPFLVSTLRASRPDAREG